ncbi:hypothetical protein Tco_0357028 [Tanacetum coccineum]
MEDTLSKFIGDSTKRHEENSNLIKEIRASTDAAIRNQGASIKTLEIQIRKMRKVLQEREFGSLLSSTKANPRDQVKSILTTIEADSCPIRREITGDDLMPTIEEGEVIEKFRTRDDELNVGIDDYPSYCDYDKKIHTDCEGFDTPRDGFGKYKLVLVVNNLVLLAFISTASFEYYYCQGKWSELILLAMKRSSRWARIYDSRFLSLRFQGCVSGSCFWKRDAFVLRRFWKAT